MNKNLILLILLLPGVTQAALRWNMNANFYSSPESACSTLCGSFSTPRSFDGLSGNDGDYFRRCICNGSVVFTPKVQAACETLEQTDYSSNIWLNGAGQTKCGIESHGVGCSITSAPPLTGPGGQTINIGMRLGSEDANHPGEYSFTGVKTGTAGCSTNDNNDADTSDSSGYYFDGNPMFDEDGEFVKYQTYEDAAQTLPVEEKFDPANLTNGCMASEDGTHQMCVSGATPASAGLTDSFTELPLGIDDGTGTNLKQENYDSGTDTYSNGTSYNNVSIYNNDTTNPSGNLDGDTGGGGDGGGEEPCTGIDCDTWTAPSGAAEFTDLQAELEGAKTSLLDSITNNQTGLASSFSVDLATNAVAPSFVIPLGDYGSYTVEMAGWLQYLAVLGYVVLAIASWNAIGIIIP